MAVKVSEYLGHSTEQSGASIRPVTGTPLCPFANGERCKKVVNDKKPPVCSVRKNSRGKNGLLWIVCSKRLCASQHNLTLSAYQSEMLFAVAKILYGNMISKADVLVKSEEQIKFRVADAKPYRADFTIQLTDPSKATLNGQEKFIVEMQGGGETSNTGQLTDLINQWAAPGQPTNSTISSIAAKVGTLETNAWRRQQEQLLVKGSAAKNTGKCGIALCIGESLFNYIIKKIDPQKIQGIKKNPPAQAWSLAIIPVIEACTTDPAGIKVGDSLPLKPDITKTLYMDYDEFIHLLVSQGENSKEAFEGDCINLDGTKVHI